MSKLEEALKTYNDTKALAGINLDEVPSRFRGGKEAQKREAETALDNLRTQYENALQESAFGLMVTGAAREEFAKIASEEAEVLSVDADELYRRLVDRVEPSMGGNREFGVSQYSLLIQELRAVGMELDVVSMPSPQWQESVNVGTGPGLAKHVRSMVDSSVGLDLISLYVRRQILDAGLKAGADKSTVPVVVRGESLDPNLSLRLFKDGRSLSVDTSATEVTKESILETFSKVKKQLKTNKKTN